MPGYRKEDAVQLRRDPFARATLMRLAVPASDRGPCPWCGRRGRFIYYWEPDGLRPYFPPARDDGVFCSVGCWEAYRG